MTRSDAYSPMPFAVSTVRFRNRSDGSEFEMQVKSDNADFHRHLAMFLNADIVEPEKKPVPIYMIPFEVFTLAIILFGALMFVGMTSPWFLSPHRYLIIAQIAHLSASFWAVVTAGWISFRLMTPKQA